MAGTDESTGGGYGVYGSSTNGTGVAGTTSGNSQDGVSGTDTSTGGGYGVNGTSTNGNGVNGTIHQRQRRLRHLHQRQRRQRHYRMGNGQITESRAIDESAGDGYGVYALSDNGTALYADGNAISDWGQLSKGGGSFKIDHPLDPARKYLYHSFVESPDMMNIYNGPSSWTGDGPADVELPDWFEALNRDYRYQLTAIGGPAPDLHIAAEVSGGQFAIAGGAAGQKVSWQVTGIRQDAWANAQPDPGRGRQARRRPGTLPAPRTPRDGEPITSIARARAHAERHRSASTAGPRPDSSTGHVSGSPRVIA